MKFKGIFCFQKILSVILIFAFSFSHLVPSSNITKTSENSSLFKKNFGSIQEAINKAEVGSTVYVPAGLYFEQVIVNKTISLVGENASTTIIDGDNSGTVVTITADNVTLANFTVRNSGWGWTRNGIYVYKADNCLIKNNILVNNCHNIRLNCSKNSRVLGNVVNGDGYGIRLINSLNCTAIGNNVSSCIGGIHLQNATNCIVKKNCLVENSQGIRMYSPCTYNIITENLVYNNTYDGMITTMPENVTFHNNVIFHNNFINNSKPFICKVTGNIWNKGYPAGGNYWSRYNGTDTHRGPYQNETGSDGIGDTPYTLASGNIDRYPLMHPWSLLPVHNINTGMGYDTIQEAIDSPETSNGHTLWVSSGIYYENIEVHKSLTLMGESSSATIIDGGNTGTVLLVNVDNVTVTGFTIRNSGLQLPPYGMDCGVLLDHVSGCNVSCNLIRNNNIGLYVFFSANNHIGRNIVSSNGYEGLWLWYSGGNVLVENQVFNNSCNFGVSGGVFRDFDNIIDSTNMVEGRPIRYVIGVENEVYDKIDVSVLYVINSNNVTVQNINLRENGHGVFFYNVSNSKISNVTVSKNKYGICLQNSVNNTLIHNNCSNNWVGIHIKSSSYNTIEGNIASNNEKGLSLYEGDCNIIAGNTISDNLYGIRLFDSGFNQVYHNNLIGNVKQGDIISSYQNVWDNGFEGNFWSDYAGVDGDKNGLGDSSYIISDSNIDYYPLFGLFHNFSVLYQNNFYEVTVVSNSTIHNFNFYSENNTIRLIVSGINGTYGFCRVCIPHALMNPDNINVIIDNGQITPLCPNYMLYDTGAYRWIYFAYPCSTHEIVIVPEASQTKLLATFLIITLAAIILKNKKAFSYAKQNRTKYA